MSLMRSTEKHSPCLYRRKADGSMAWATCSIKRFLSSPLNTKIRLVCGPRIRLVASNVSSAFRQSGLDHSLIALTGLILGVAMVV